MGVLDHLDQEPFFTLLRALSPLLQPIFILLGARGFWRTCCFLDHFGGLDHLLVHFGATGGAFGLGAPFLYQGQLWRTFGAHLKPPIAYTRAVLVHDFVVQPEYAVMYLLTIRG